jgi:hypothetical protein
MVVLEDVQPSETEDVAANRGREDVRRNHFRVRVNTGKLL